MALLESQPKQVGRMVVDACQQTPAFLTTGAGIAAGIAFAQEYLKTPSLASSAWNSADLCWGSLLGATGACLSFGCTTALTALLKDCCIMQYPDSHLSQCCFTKETRTRYQSEFGRLDFWERLMPVLSDALRKGLGMAAAGGIWLPLRQFLMGLLAHVSQVLALCFTSLTVGAIGGMAFLLMLVTIKYYCRYQQNEPAAQLYQTNEWFHDLKLSLYNVTCSIITFTLFSQSNTAASLHGLSLLLGGSLSFFSGFAASAVIETAIKAMLTYMGLWNQTTGWLLRTTSGERYSNGTACRGCCVDCLLPCLQCMGPNAWTKSLAGFAGARDKPPTEVTGLLPVTHRLVREQPV